MAILSIVIVFSIKSFHSPILLNNLLELPSDSDIVLMFFSSAYKMDTTSNYHPYTTSDDSVEFELESLISDTTVKSLGPIDFFPVDDNYEIAFYITSTNFTGRKHFSFYIDSYYIYLDGQLYTYDNKQLYKFAKEKAIQTWEPAKTLEVFT